MSVAEFKLPDISPELRMKLLESERDLYSTWVHAILHAAGWDFKKQPSPRAAIKDICDRLSREVAP